MDLNEINYKDSMSKCYLSQASSYELNHNFW